MSNVYNLIANVRREEELSEDETCKVVEQMFESVMQVDKARILHSDIRCNNSLLYRRVCTTELWKKGTLKCSYIVLYFITVKCTTFNIAQRTSLILNNVNLPTGRDTILDFYAQAIDGHKV